MLYTYKQSLEADIYKDSVLVSLQPKNQPIHQGHVKLIEFAKTFGNVVVWITRRHIEYFTYLTEGISIPKDDSDVEAELNSLDKLGVNVVLRYNSLSLDKPHPRTQALKDFYSGDLKDVLISKALQGIEVPPHKVNSLRVKLIEYAMVPRNLGIKAIVRGPEFENFILKNVRTKYPRPPIEIFPEVVKDEYGLKYRTSQHLSNKQIEILRRMVKDNAGKVTVYEGPIFNGRLELIEYLVPHDDGIGNDWVEETNYAVSISQME